MRADLSQQKSKGKPAGKAPSTSSSRASEGKGKCEGEGEANAKAKAKGKGKGKASPEVSAAANEYELLGPGCTADDSLFAQILEDIEVAEAAKTSLRPQVKVRNPPPPTPPLAMVVGDSGGESGRACTPPIPDDGWPQGYWGRGSESDEEDH